MKIGAMNHPARNPLEEIEWIGKNGFDFVDFTLEPPAADPDQIEPGAVRAALDRHHLGVVAHTAGFIPFGSPFGGVRDAALGEFRRALRAAHRIGAKEGPSRSTRLGFDLAFAGMDVQTGPGNGRIACGAMRARKDGRGNGGGR